ncbi:MAG: hypothetical protein WBF77_03815 [Sulfurimonadaceae bacterium]
MSKFASFGSVVLLFVLLSVVVVFGFFVFTPKIKAYRALNIELQLRSADLVTAEKEFDRHYAELQNLQDREKNIDIALHKHFDEERFETYLSQYFTSFTLRSITSEQSKAFQTEVIDVRAKIASPEEYYRFIEALNLFEWVVEVDGTLQFKGVEDGIDTHFTLKVYTKVQ